MSEASAAQQYFDPPDERWPTCDICDEPMDDTVGEESDWNGETGNHETCEEREAEDDGEEFLRKMETAMDEHAAGLPFGGSS